MKQQICYLKKNRVVYTIPMSNGFVTWLTGELDRRGWSNGELARRADMVPSTISMVISERNGPSLEFCAKVARAFGMRDVDVLREAGLIDSVPPEVQEEHDLLNLIRGLSPQQRRSALAMLHGLAQHDDVGGRRVRAPRPHTEPIRRDEPGQLALLEAEFEAELAQLPPDATDADIRAIAQRARERIWEIATPQQRQLLAQLYAAMAATLREERESKQDCIPQSEPVS